MKSLFFRRAHLLCVLLLCWLPPVLAQPSGNPADHPLLPRFNGATIVEYLQQTGANYELPLGPMIRAAGRASPASSRRIRGLVTRITYEIPQAFTGADVNDYYSGLVSRAGYRSLYSCAGRECGNSNYWANDVFNNRILYGPERSQFFLAASTSQAEGEGAYLAMYVVTRANRRIYAHVEIIEPAAVGSAAYHGLLDKLTREGAVRVDGLSFDADGALVGTEPLADVVALLQDNPQLRVVVVAHLNGAGDLELLLARSRDRADNVRSALLEQGLPPEQIEARGLGPLAPLCDGGRCGERIELVLQPR